MRVPSLIVIGLMSVLVSTRRRPDRRHPRRSGNVQRQRPGQGRGGRDRSHDPDSTSSAYTPDFDRTAVETALKQGRLFRGSCMRCGKAPEVGYVAAGEKKFPIRWAREQKTAKGRTIVVITDTPVFFVGGGSADAKPRAGYEVAVIQLVVDDIGLG